MITLQIMANYTDRHPFVILKKIKTKSDVGGSIVQPIKMEALKILNRFRRRPDIK